ncbi:MAG: AAA family ATPase [Flavobacteriales bacterium]|nr:AAA family ATPase [Flavobacteriales bacterium]
MITSKNNIVFIGGIHGVGKSTICNSICNALKISYLSASDVLKWSKLNSDVKNKKVEDISLTQNLLINGLNEHVQKDCKYILDGHYCLLNKDGHVERIPIETFQKINPNALSVIIAGVTEIKNHLESRDNRAYDFDLLNEMQETEIQYAKDISSLLRRPLFIAQKDEITELINFIKSTTL